MDGFEEFVEQWIQNILQENKDQDSSTNNLTDLEKEQSQDDSLSHSPRSSPSFSNFPSTRTDEDPRSMDCQYHGIVTVKSPRSSLSPTLVHSESQRKKIQDECSRSSQDDQLQVNESVEKDSHGFSHSEEAVSNPPEDVLIFCGEKLGIGEEVQEIEHCKICPSNNLVVIKLVGSKETFPIPKESLFCTRQHLKTNFVCEENKLGNHNKVKVKETFQGRFKRVLENFPHHFFSEENWPFKFGKQGNDEVTIVSVNALCEKRRGKMKDNHFSKVSFSHFVCFPRMEEKDRKRRRSSEYSPSKDSSNKKSKDK